VLGNLEALIAHRQNVPESAELIAAMAGSKPMWITTQQTEEGLLGHTAGDRGTRRRGWEFEIHPNQIKALPTGWAAVLTPGAGQRGRRSRGSITLRRLIDEGENGGLQQPGRPRAA
jgi:hypothetical protein